MAMTSDDAWVLRGQKPPEHQREGWGCADVDRFGDGSGFSGHSEMTDWNGIGWSTGGRPTPPRHAWRYKCTIRG